ncbi:MAG: N-acetyltransferase [Chloroflexota bacterium]
MSMLQVRPVETKQDLMVFISFAWEVYRGDANWVPPLVSMMRDMFDPARNPLWEHSQFQNFLAYRDGRVVGRITALVNANHNRIHEEKMGFFGFFEVLQDYEAAQALFDAAGDWVRSKGMTALRGPANPTVNDEYGLLVDGFDSLPVVMMPYNPPYYAGFIERYGFSKVMDLWAYHLDTAIFGGEKVDKLPEKLVRVVEAARKRYAYAVRAISLKDWPAEVERFKKVYNAAWEKNWGAVAMTEHEIQHLADSLKQIMDPDLVFIVERDGEVVGVSITLPDVNQALWRARPHPKTWEPWTLLKFFWHYKIRSCIDGIRVLILGVMEPYRGKGVDALLYYETAMAALPKGYKNAEMSWILETNTPMNRAIQFLGGEVYKTYRIYQKPLG